VPGAREARTGAIALNFGMRGDIADVITRVKFYVSRFSSSGVMTPRFRHSPEAYAAFYWARELVFAVNTSCRFVRKRSSELEI